MTDQYDGVGDNNPSSPTKRRGLRLAVLLATGLGLLAAASWGYGYVTFGRFQEENNNAYLQIVSVQITLKVMG